MPELPDVEGFRAVLAEHGAGRRVERVEVTDAGVLRDVSAGQFERSLRGRGQMRRVLRAAIPAGRVPARARWLTGNRAAGDAACPRCAATLVRGRLRDAAPSGARAARPVHRSERDSPSRSGRG